ncbi:pseudaminic acid synthase [Roseovarius sp. TE539]|uniref:pseudaminic acid synthase n=1 Tax=Roseovarius sp. TE539 TaxID=2249812 RepID=UPI000DE08645|nr:pseudaminic acid synthase [Roseovarius sp. TE539]RBI72248.1 pseudaminic acid synthase [Roseovarius sp. TE539]
MTEIRIAGRPVGPGHPPYVIAELSANHNGSLYQALRIIDAAIEAGADAVKIQTYHPDTITLESDAPDFRITEGLWAGRTLYDLYEWAHTPWGWHEALFAHAAERGITLFSSPFDPTAVDLLASLGAPAYKIASFEIVDLSLIRYVAAKGRPMILSTGMADLAEIAEAVDAARSGGCLELALLHCVSGYPAPASDYNLSTLRDMADRFKVPIGLSDHTQDNVTAIASIALGASIIEKHLTLDRDGGGPDDSFSLEPAQFAALCRDARTAWRAIGRVDYDRKPSEAANVVFRRSIYAVRDIAKGTRITSAHVRSIRPGHGLAPRQFDVVIGACAKRDITRGEAMQWDMIERQA